MSRWDSRLDALEERLRTPEQAPDLTPDVEYAPAGGILIPPRVARKLLEHIGE